MQFAAHKHDEENMEWLSEVVILQTAPETSSNLDQNELWEVLEARSALQRHTQNKRDIRLPRMNRMQDVP